MSSHPSPLPPSLSAGREHQLPAICRSVRPHRRLQAQHEDSRQARILGSRPVQGEGQDTAELSLAPGPARPSAQSAFLTPLLLLAQLTALCTVPPTEWSPSAPPPPSAAPASANSSRPSSAQGVRKPRGFRNGSSGLSREAESGGFEDDEASRRKAANESFFDGLGRANESRSADLPPSQG